LVEVNIIYAVLLDFIGWLLHLIPVLLQSLRSRCIECAIHHERDMCEEQYAYSRTPMIRTPIIRNAYYPNTTLTKACCIYSIWSECCSTQLLFLKKMRDLAANKSDKFKTKKNEW